MGWLKLVHVSAVIVSGALFFLRGMWQWNNSPTGRQKWVTVAPHINDTFLLLSAIGLAWQYRLYPFVDAWLTAKVLALLLYIALGTVAMRQGKTRRQRISAWVLAMMVYGYIVIVALTKSTVWGLG